MAWIWYFTAYSFLGYCLEKIFARLTHSPRQVRRCFLVLPLCPVYGLAMAAILALGGGFHATWEQAFFGGVTATAVEYAVHWGYERVFGVQFWDYSDTKMDVDGRICLPFSVAWGVLSLLAVRYIQPELHAAVSRIPLEWGTVWMTMLGVDAMYTARTLLRWHDPELLSLPALRRREKAS